MDLNLKEMISLIELSNLRLRKEPYMTELAEYLNYKSDDIHFRKIKKWLQDNRIMKVYLEDGKKYAEIDWKKLDEFIPEIPYNRLLLEKYPNGVTYK